MKFARIALLFAALGAVDVVRAEDPPAEKASAAGDVDLLSQAHRLAAFAAEHKSPEAYIAAAGLLRKVDALNKGKLTQLDAKFEVLNEKGEPIPGATAKVEAVGSLKDQADDYFEAASALGAELKTGREVEALIKLAKERSYDRGARGNAAGPRACAVTLQAGEKHTTTLSFVTGVPARVRFEATGNVKLRLAEDIKVAKGDDRKTLINITAAHGDHTWIPTAPTPLTPTTFSISNPTNKPVIVKIFTN